MDETVRLSSTYIILYITKRNNVQHIHTIICIWHIIDLTFLE